VEQKGVPKAPLDQHFLPLLKKVEKVEKVEEKKKQ
jgi:hypothetical protein